MGDVLLDGPRGPCHRRERRRDVTFLAGPHGTGAAALLPGVNRVLEWRAPWIDAEPGEFDPGHVRSLVQRMRRLGPAVAVVFTSFHQSPLPMALALRMAGVPRIAAISEDYPGSLLDVRHPPTGDIPEAERNLSLARAAGFELPAGDSRAAGRHGRPAGQPGTDRRRSRTWPCTPARLSRPGHRPRGRRRPSWPRWPPPGTGLWSPGRPPNPRLPPRSAGQPPGPWAAAR